MIFVPVNKKNRKNKSKNFFSPGSKWLIFLCVVVFFGLLYVLKISGSGVLGTSTLIARGGDDSGSGSSGSGSGGDSGSISGSGSGSNDSQNTPEPTSSNTNTFQVENNPVINSFQPKPSRKPEVENENKKPEIKKDKTETEVKISENERIKARVKDSFTRIDITQGGVKTKLEFKDGKTVVKAEQVDGTETELDDSAETEVQNRLAEDGIKLEALSDGQTRLQTGSESAISKFPLSIDLSTNTLSVKTASGQEHQIILPKQAISNLLALGLVDKINPVGSSESAQLEISNQDIPVYKVKGVSEQKFFGLLPVKIEKKVELSAETGQVISSNVSLTDKIKDFFSF